MYPPIPWAQFGDRCCNVHSVELRWVVCTCVNTCSYIYNIYIYINTHTHIYIQGGSNMTRTDLCVNKPHCAAAVRP